MQRILIIVSLAFLLCGFQNCQPAKISGVNNVASKADGDLTPVVSNDPEDEAEGEIEQPAAPPAADRPGNGNANDNDNNNDNGQNDYAGNYVCILEGPGKSVKLGMSTAGVPGGQNPIPQVLCMSKNACLNIASQVFGVKGPEFRGYCKLPHGNPHVTHITDAQLQLKVDDLKP